MRFTDSKKQIDICSFVYLNPALFAYNYCHLITNLEQQIILIRFDWSNVFCLLHLDISIIICCQTVFVLIRKFFNDYIYTFSFLFRLSNKTTNTTIPGHFVYFLYKF